MRAVIRQYEKRKGELYLADPAHTTMITDSLLTRAEKKARKLVEKGEMEEGYFDLVLIGYNNEEIDSVIGWA